MSVNVPANPARGAKLMIALIMLVAASKAVLYDSIDPDCFWHLRVAEQLLQNGVGPIVDNLSFASIRDPWTPYSWLAELGMKLAWEIGGYRAAIVIHALNSALIVLLMALSCREMARQRGAPLLAIIISITFGAFFTLAYLSFRPASFAIALLALVVWILIRDQRAELKPSDSHRWVFVIPLITILLTNIHLYAFLVPIWTGALSLGATWERRSEQARRYAWLTLACASACLMTPMLPGMMQTILHYQFSDTMVAGPVIVEMQPFYTGVFGWVMLPAVAGFAACVVVNRKSLSAGHLIWILIGAALMFRLGRFSPLFAMVAAPALTVTLPRMSDRILARRATIAALTAVLLIGLLRLLSAFPFQQSLDQWVNRHGGDVPSYPCAAADFVQGNVKPLSARVINEFRWGGYLAWRIPSFQVLMDGRTQVYPEEFWKSTYLGDSAQRREIILQSRADVAIVPAQGGIFSEELRALGWKSVYRDDFANVMLPPDTPLARTE